jgi:hypothetical protein
MLRDFTVQFRMDGPIAGLLSSVVAITRRLEQHPEQAALVQRIRLLHWDIILMDDLYEDGDLENERLKVALLREALSALGAVLPKLCNLWHFEMDPALTLCAGFQDNLVPALLDCQMLRSLYLRGEDEDTWHTADNPGWFGFVRGLTSPIDTLHIVLSDEQIGCELLSTLPPAAARNLTVINCDGFYIDRLDHGFWPAVTHLTLSRCQASLSVLMQAFPNVRDLSLRFMRIRIHDDEHLPTYQNHGAPAPWTLLSRLHLGDVFDWPKATTPLPRVTYCEIDHLEADHLDPEPQPFAAIRLSRFLRGMGAVVADVHHLDTLALPDLVVNLKVYGPHTTLIALRVTIFVGASMRAEDVLVRSLFTEILLV